MAFTTIYSQFAVIKPAGHMLAVTKVVKPLRMSSLQKSVAAFKLKWCPGRPHCCIDLTWPKAIRNMSGPQGEHSFKQDPLWVYWYSASVSLWALDIVRHVRRCLVPEIVLVYCTLVDEVVLGYWYGSGALIGLEDIDCWLSSAWREWSSLHAGNGNVIIHSVIFMGHISKGLAMLSCYITFLF